MSGPSVTVEAGGSPTGEQAMAILAAASAVLDDERRARAGVDLGPPQYRSAWRSAAIREGLRRPLCAAGRS